MAKSHWQSRRDGRDVYVQIAGDQVIVGEDSGDRHRDSATSVSREEFLSGKLQDVVRDYLGDDGLAEVVQALRG